jgi:hypothetical protein
VKTAADTLGFLDILYTVESQKRLADKIVHFSASRELLRQSEANHDAYSHE